MQQDFVQLKFNQILLFNEINISLFSFAFLSQFIFHFSQSLVVGTMTTGQMKFQTTEKGSDVRMSNIIAAKSVASAIRTSLGPRGMDKMIQKGDGDVVISNDGATILKLISVIHPCAKMLVEVSAAQDVEAGDGTTSVVVLTGALLAAAEKLLNKGIHPSRISEAFLMAKERTSIILREMSIPVDLKDRVTLEKSAATSLSSKIVSQHAPRISQIAVEAVMRIFESVQMVDLKQIRVIPRLGGTIEDMELVNGVVLTQEAMKAAGGPNRMEAARIALVQFQLSPPKPDMDNQIVVNDYKQMDRILREERQYLLEMCKKIKKTNCNVLLVQKSILRDAVSELALHFLAKLKIMTISNIERDDFEYLSKNLDCKPIADIESFTEDKLGYADLVEEVALEGCSYTRITGIKGKTPVSVVCRGANQAILEEVERSLHDALCVVRCLVKERAFVAGGGAPEIQASICLSRWAQTLSDGIEAVCIGAYADALDVIPASLAENAGLDPVGIVTELRNRHAMGDANAGINIRKGIVSSNILEEDVMQPLLVSLSAISLATETAAMILKIDDIVQSR